MELIRKGVLLLVEGVIDGDVKWVVVLDIWRMVVVKYGECVVLVDLYCDFLVELMFF